MMNPVGGEGRFGIPPVPVLRQERATDQALRAICAARRKRQNASEARGSVGIRARTQSARAWQPCRNCWVGLERLGRLLNEGQSTGWAPGGLLDGYMAFGLSKCESYL